MVFNDRRLKSTQLLQLLISSFFQLHRRRWQSQQLLVASAISASRGLQRSSSTEFTFGCMQVDCSKSDPTDETLSLKEAWSRHVTHFNL